VRVLLVEDDQPVAESLRRGLLRYGFQVEWVTTGHAALAHQGPYDVVLLGPGLPDTDGLGVCKALRTRGDRALRLRARPLHRQTAGHGRRRDRDPARRARRRPVGGRQPSGITEEWWLTISHLPPRFSYSYVQRASTVRLAPVSGSVSVNSYRPVSMAEFSSRTSTTVSIFLPTGLFSRKCSK
jgi:CheY-like chemotaxis protein